MTEVEQAKRDALLEYAHAVSAIDPSALWDREQIADDVRVWTDHHYPDLRAPSDAPCSAWCHRPQPPGWACCRDTPPE